MKERIFLRPSLFSFASVSKIWEGRSNGGRIIGGEPGENKHWGWSKGERNKEDRNKGEINKGYRNKGYRNKGERNKEGEKGRVRLELRVASEIRKLTNGFTHNFHNGGDLGPVIKRSTLRQ